MRKFLSKIAIIVLAIGIMVTGLNTYAATGYSYDHNKKVIYSTEGLIYDHAFNAQSLGIEFQNLKNPEDLFLYKNASTYEVEAIYLCETSATFKNDKDETLPSTGAIYEFDPEFNLTATYTSFPLDVSLKNDKGEYIITDEMLTSVIRSGGKFVVNEKDEEAKKQILSDIRKTGFVDIYLSQPKSVFRYVVTKLEDDPDLLYVCDYGNQQVLVVDTKTNAIRQIITDPNKGVSGAVYSSSSFKPLKVVCDNAGRIYVISESVYEGILQFDADGSYKRFTGVNYVTLTAWNIFWLTMATEEQYESKQQYINTTFTSMALDSTGTFIYSTSDPIKNDNGSFNTLSMIKKLNPAGKDVLSRTGYYPPQGDISYIASDVSGNPYPYGPSAFSCVTVNQYGMYTILDSKRNKLFTYDDSGNLLYISSESGIYSNTLQTPVAIQYYGQDLLVLDKGTKEIKVFVPTEIGGYINDATIAESTGNVDDAAQKWKKVIQYNANYEYAYVGVGKGYLKNKDYKNAMEYFKKGSNKLQYSEAYKLYRNGLIKKYAPIVLYVAIGIAVVCGVTKFILKKTGHYKGKEKPQEDLGE